MIIKTDARGSKSNCADNDMLMISKRMGLD